VDHHYYTYSSIFFYTGRSALLLNGRYNNLVYGSYAPGAPDVELSPAMRAGCITFGSTNDFSKVNREVIAVWAQVIGTVGDYESMGEPYAHQAGDYTVVQVPLQFEAGGCLLTVSYSADDRVAGLFVKPTR